YDGGKFSFLGKAFSIQATNAAGEPVSEFDQPFTLTFDYTDADLPAACIDPQNEAQLDLYYWDDEAEQWVATGATVEPETNRLTAQLDHLTTFAVGVAQEPGVYLPSLAR